MVTQYERNTARPAVYLILRKGDEILLMRRQGSGYYDGWYSVPAGHVEAKELPLDALVREIKEELGIIFNKEHTHFVHAMYRTKHDETGDRADYFLSLLNGRESQQSASRINVTISGGFY